MPSKKIQKTYLPAVISVRDCARCGNNHVGVLFKPFTRPAGKYVLYGICPTTQEPILMYITRDAKPKRRASP